MSVNLNEARGKYEVRWREGGMCRRGCSTARATRTRSSSAKRSKQLGALAPSVLKSKQTLAEFMEEDGRRRYAIPDLAPDTRRRYLEVWASHSRPRTRS
jgi:hypothetical protein